MIVEQERKSILSVLVTFLSPHKKKNRTMDVVEVFAAEIIDGKSPMEASDSNKGRQ